MRFVHRIRLLLITAWVGSLWTVGYLVAPTLFMTLADQGLAGTIAGKLFRVEAWLSVVIGVCVLLMLRARRPGELHRLAMFKLVGAMLGCTLLGYFTLQPSMAALREAAAGAGLEGNARTQFGLLHGIASMLYLIQSLLGVMLVIKNVASDRVMGDATVSAG